MRIKICGITNLNDAISAIDAGADLLGFNFYSKSPRYITPEICVQIQSSIINHRSSIASVGVFVNSSAEEILSILDMCELNLAQLSGDESPETLAALKETVIPFVSHRAEFKDEKIKSLFDEILKEEGLTMEEFRIRGMKKTYFRKGERRMIIFPSEVTAGEIEKDDLNAKKYKITLDFKLPRGAYATILIKRLSYDFDKSN